jgi:hypothetical protein
MKESALNRARDYRFSRNGKFGTLLKSSSPSTYGKFINFNMKPEVEPWYQDVIHIEVNQKKVTRKEWVSD